MRFMIIVKATRDSEAAMKYLCLVYRDEIRRKS
jgi:hypothetical protein